MSKIQKALQKIQSSRRQAGTGKRRSDTHGVSPLLARNSGAGNGLTGGESESTHGVVIEVDQKTLRDAGLIAPDCDEKIIADQYRDIKRPLIANAYGKRVSRVEDGNLIIVTSALAGEGKTFTSLNLAISIAQEQDLTVLLVDGDVVKPTISDVFGVAEMPGLLDLLQGDSQGPESLVVPTDMKGLSILPAGAPRPDATELLSGSRMENIMRQFVGRFSQRVVIFDTPPLLQTSESKVLTSMAGQIVLVVKAESTSHGAVAEALQVLGADKTVNLILNQSRTAGIENRYEYGYGYERVDAPQDAPLKRSIWD